MRESSPPTAETADDNPGQWDILVNGESIQEKDDVTMAKHNGDEGCLIAATSNKAAAEHQMVQRLLGRIVVYGYNIMPLSFSIGDRSINF
jgi:hypothetical protein